MGALLVAVQTESDPLTLAFDMIDQSNDRIKRLYELIEEERINQGYAKSVVWNQVGKALVASGKQQKKVGDHIVYAGMNETLYCACHASTKMSECDTEGDIVILRGAPAPYVKVVRCKSGEAE